MTKLLTQMEIYVSPGNEGGKVYLAFLRLTVNFSPLRLKDIYKKSRLFHRCKKKNNNNKKQKKKQKKIRCCFKVREHALRNFPELKKKKKRKEKVEIGSMHQRRQWHMKSQ